MILKVTSPYILERYFLKIVKNFENMGKLVEFVKLAKYDLPFGIIGKFDLFHRLIVMKTLVFIRWKLWRLLD